jgi:hypothetical protein
MRVTLALFVIAAMSCACVRKVPVKPPDVVEITPYYGIAVAEKHTRSTVYYIHAYNESDAIKVANTRLNCAKQICTMTPGGVIMVIERFDKVTPDSK